jgi:hypothetical protein
MVGDVEVIIFMGTKLDGLKYYGIMANHLIMYMCPLKAVNSCCHITP